MFLREALRPLVADRQGALTPPPPDRPRYEKCPDLWALDLLSKKT